MTDKEFIDWLIDYIFECDENGEELVSEVICRKLIKAGALKRVEIDGEICQERTGRMNTGEWQITDAYPHNVYCSVCHKKFAQTHWAVWEDGSLPRNYCPNCGADMRGEA